MNRPTFWFRSDWVNPFARGYNWLDFTLVLVSGEYDCRFGNVEFHVALLGFHFGGQWKVADGDVALQAELQDMMRRMGIADEETSGREHGDGTP